MFFCILFLAAPAFITRIFLISYQSFEFEKNEVQCICSWVKVFRVNPEFRILRLTYVLVQPQNAELGSS